MNKKFWYLTKLSFNKKVKSKWFIITNIILLVAIVILFNISAIIEFFGGDFDAKTNIIVVDNANAYEIFASNLTNFADNEDYSISKSNEDIETLKNNLASAELLIVLNSSPTEYLTSELISLDKVDNLTYQIILQALNSTKSTIGMIASDIDPEVLANISASITVERTIINDSATTDENMDMIMSSVFPTLILPFFMLIIFLVQMVGGEVCEEKTTRSMEIIISNVSPKVHLLSKVLASNIFVILQSILLILYCVIAYVVSIALGGASLSSTFDFASIFSVFGQMGNTIFLVIPVTIILIILSFLSYAIVAGILASMTVNIEDFNQLQTPIMLLSIAGYYLAVMAAMFDGSIFIRIISYIPFLSVFISPTLFVLGQITIFDMLLSVLILILFIFILLKFGLKVYKSGILNYSSDKVWSKLFKEYQKNKKSDNL